MNMRNSQTIKTLGCVVLLGVLALGGCGEKEMEYQPAPVEPNKVRVDAQAVLSQSAVSSDVMTRMHAIEAIANAGRLDMAGLCLQGLNDKSVKVRFAAAMALGDLKYAPAKASLLKLVEDPKSDQRVVCAAIYALKELGNTEYAYQLGTMLFSNFTPARAEAAHAMGKMGEPSAIAPLRALLREEVDPSVRLSGFEALARLGDVRSMNILESYGNELFLDMRLAAVPTIAEVRTPHAINVLTELLQPANPPRLRVMAAGALGTLGDTTHLDICEKAIGDPFGIYREKYGDTRLPQEIELASLRRLAALAMGEIGNPRSLAWVYPLLQDQDGAVRVAAALAAMQILREGPAAAKAPATSEKASESASESIPTRKPKLHTAGGLD